MASFGKLSFAFVFPPVIYLFNLQEKKRGEKNCESWGTKEEDPHTLMDQKRWQQFNKIISYFLDFFLCFFGEEGENWDTNRSVLSELTLWEKFVQWKTNFSIRTGWMNELLLDKIDSRTSTTVFSGGRL